MATYELRDLNGELWTFGRDQPIGILDGTLKGVGIAEYSLETLHGVGQRGVTVVGTDLKEGQIGFTAVIQPYQVGLRGGDAVELVSRFIDGLGQGEVERDENQARFTVVDSERFQAVRLVKLGQVDWERVRSSRMCKVEIVLQSDESDWRTEPLDLTFAPAAFATAKVANDGTVDSWPWFRLTGPITDPTLGLDGEAVKLPNLTAGQYLEIETEPNWYQVTDQTGTDRTWDLYTLADGDDDRWRQFAPARTPEIPVTITGTGTSGATSLRVVVPQIYRSPL